MNHNNLFKKQEILKMQPDIKKLYGYEWKSKWISLLFLFIPQIYISLNIYKLSILNYFLVTYFIGATITQALFLAIHELTHNLFFKKIKYNKLFSIFLNLPIIIPFSISFRDYHLEHHKNLGVYGLDTDLPSKLEKCFIHGTIKKTIWLSMQIICYAIRPILIKKYTFTFYHYLNIIVQTLFNILILKIYGYNPIIYLLLCDIIAGGLHPCAYHFISEHYLLSDTKQETYSYYGSLNYLTWNVGYHNEHHDFPNVPWSRLHKIKIKMYNYYDNLIKYDSWYTIFYKFIFDNNVTMNSRIINNFS